MDGWVGGGVGELEYGLFGLRGGGFGGTVWGVGDLVCLREMAHGLCRNHSRILGMDRQATDEVGTCVASACCPRHHVVLIIQISP